jgi:hypothetical protein
VSETAPQLLHSEAWGGDFSGRALRILLLRTLAKVNRKRLYYDTAVRKIIELAQRVEGVDDPVEVSLIWPDGLPQDTGEQLDIADRRIANRTLSRRQAVMRLDDKDEEEADAVLAEVDDEDNGDLERVAATMPRPAGTPPTIPVRVNMGGNEE